VTFKAQSEARQLVRCCCLRREIFGRVTDFNFSYCVPVNKGGGGGKIMVNTYPYRVSFVSVTTICNSK